MRKDYHASGNYEVDEPAISQTGLALAWFLSGAKRRLRSFLLWAAPPSSSATLLNDGERHFSQLGARSSKRPAVRGDESPFPTEAARFNNNWRVLP
jgi:hypothetical protein